MTEEQKKDSVPVHQYISLAASKTGKTNQELAEEVGFARGNVIAMIRSGSMKCPLNKVVKLAKAIDVDPADLLRRVLGPNDAALLDTFEEISGTRIVTANEYAFIEWIRRVSGKLDIGWHNRPEFVAAAQPVIENLAKAASRESQRQVKKLVENDGRHAPAPKRKVA